MLLVDAGAMDAPPDPSRPLIVTRDRVLREELLRLCAAAAVTPHVIEQPDGARRSWSHASCVLVGDDCADAVARLALGRRDDVVLVARGQESAALWQRGVAVRADHVALVPDAEAWLVERIADTVDNPAATAVTLGIIGARGGAGASTLAAALGLCAARRGQEALLVDVDTLAGGVELVVGCEDVAGLRWPEVAETRGRVSSSALRAALPNHEDLAVLSFDRTDDVQLEPATLQAMLSSARRGSDLVVVDLSRRVDTLVAEALPVLDVLILVSTLDVGAAAGASRLLALLEPLCPDIRLVVRRTSAASVDVESLAATLRLPLLAVLPSPRSTTRAVNEGLGPLGCRRLARGCARLLDEVAPVTRKVRS